MLLRLVAWSLLLILLVILLDDDVEFLRTSAVHARNESIGLVVQIVGTEAIHPGASAEGFSTAEPFVGGLLRFDELLDV